MIRLLRFLTRRQWGLMAVSVAAIAGQVWLNLRIPEYMAAITQLVHTGQAEMTAILADGGWMLACAAGAMLAAVAAGYLSTYLASSFSRQLRAAVFAQVEQFSMAEIDGFSTASLITRSTNDVTQIQNFMSRGLRMMISMPLTAGWALYKISTRYWQWTALTGAAVAVMAGVIVFLMIYAHPRLRRRQAMTDELSRILRENLTGIRVIRAYDAEDYQQAKFDKANDVLTDSETKAHRAMSLMRPAMKFVNNITMVGIYCIGAYLIAGAASGQRLTIFSDMIVFSSYAAALIQSFLNLNMVFNQYPRAAVSAERINKVLDAMPTIADGDDHVERCPAGRLEFRHVSFSYQHGGQPVLQDVSFTAAPGQTVAFIGATGAGKTTLVNLIPRLYDVTAGQILLDGIDIRRYGQKQLRDRLGYASQKAVLFTGTVAFNVGYGDDGRPAAGPQDIDQALRVAQADGFVAAMDGGQQALVYRGGTNLSGGQRQRLSIARAVCRRPELYIFDDAFSALDYQTDRALRDDLRRQARGVTTIIVAQRIGTIRDADVIIVLDGGRVVGQGTHDQLLRGCELYRQIAQTQLSPEELANA